MEPIEFVWARVPGSPPWPGMIWERPPPYVRRYKPTGTLTRCVFFFGTKEYAWMEKHRIYPFFDKLGTFIRATRGSCGVLAMAVEQMQAYMFDRVKFASNGPPVADNRKLN